jgi:cbb3-type cytochrome oxidase subunit 3
MKKWLPNYKYAVLLALVLGLFMVPSDVAAESEQCECELYALGGSCEDPRDYEESEITFSFADSATYGDIIGQIPVDRCLPSVPGIDMDLVITHDEREVSSVYETTVNSAATCNGARMDKDLVLPPPNIYEPELSYGFECEVDPGSGQCNCAWNVGGGSCIGVANFEVGVVSFDISGTWVYGDVINNIATERCVPTGIDAASFAPPPSSAWDQSIDCAADIFADTISLPPPNIYDPELEYGFYCYVESRTGERGGPDGESADEDPKVRQVVSALTNLNQFPNTSIPVLIGRLMLFALLGILGTAALGMFIYAGLLWMFSGGNSERQKKALLIMLWTSMGVVVTLASYAILKFLFAAFGA